MQGPRANLTTPQAVMCEHSGELTFWLAWLADELHADLRAWFREQAGHDPVLRKDLESIDQPAAREQLHNALEATNYLTPRDAGPDGGAELTGLALKEGATAETVRERAPPSDARRRATRDAGPRELRQCVSRSLFLLLDEVEIPLPPSDEVREATALLHHLVGLPAVDRFRQLAGWVHEVRLRAGAEPAPVLDRVLNWLTPELFQTDGPAFRHHLSFRLYLRYRLKDFCKRRGWRPAGPLYRDLDSAFARLERDRIGLIVYQAIEETADVSLQEARVSPHQVLQWLQVAP
jgi:hypothetical protein